MADNKFLNDANYKLAVQLVKKEITKLIPKFVRWFVSTTKISNMLVGYVNSKADQVIPDSIDDILNEALGAAVKENWDQVTYHLSSLPKEFYDIKAFDAVEQKTYLALNSKLIIYHFQRWASNKKE